jgi:hypothetical protein
MLKNIFYHATRIVSSGYRRNLITYQQFKTKNYLHMKILSLGTALHTLENKLRGSYTKQPPPP